MDKQWDEWRRNGIGASDAPVIMGVSPFKTINQLWKEKVMGWKQPSNEAMERGKRLEDEALGKFMMETGLLMSSQVMKEHEKIPWMRATLDGYEEKENILVEVKTCRNIHQEVPKHYYPQLQHQMEVANADWMYYYSYDGSCGKTLKVEKNPSYVEKMIQKEKEFWERMKEGFLNLCEDEEFNFHLHKVATIKKTLQELREEEKFHFSQLLLFSDGCAAIGKGGMIFQQVRKGQVNYGDIPQLKGLDLEPYRNPSSTHWCVKFDNHLPKN